MALVKGKAMTLMTHRWTHAAAALAVGTLAVTTVTPAAADETDKTIEGFLADSTPYRFVVPEDWNGTVFVDLDFASGGPSESQQALIDDGAAYGGTTRDVTGWNLRGAVDNQIEALDAFAATAGVPSRAIAMGQSMGGMIAATTGELHPDRIDGVVAGCGGLSGTVSQWNQKLDTVFTLGQLIDPTLPVVDIPDDIEAARALWQGALAEAQQSPEGRARIALASAIGQLPAWSQSVEDPDPKDPRQYEAGWYGSLSGDPLPYIGQAMSSRKTSTEVFGGLPSWNVGIDYAEQLRKASAESRRVVKALYDEAGLSLKDDLATVNGAERIEADPDAVERFAASYEFTGDISVPTLTLNAVGDQISTVAQQSAYEQRVNRAGNAPLLRQTYVGSAGHCAFSDAEVVTAANVLLDRLDTGHWGGSTAVHHLNAAAEALDMGEARFLNYRPDRFNR
ncbi:alpha/beta hydrolase [Paramicrobacterium fandaimingii]|uniref:alpha/beta hydrolase n=1 Tax=Paramicrobacterium fandaimingii TaxID=2708079 RepID=UPI001FD43C13|nr:alpha/beta fold hydrolase [Microbacterium fandaimingii]